MVDLKLVATFAAGAVTASGVFISLLKRSTFLHRLILKNVIVTPSPDPCWKPGQKQIGPYEDLKFVQLDPSEIGASHTYPLVISASVPRPIAFVSSINADGTIKNLAPYSYFNCLAHDPPHVAIGMCHSKEKKDGLKDSLTNILSSKEFTVCLISDWFVESANHTCGMFDYGVNEMELAGLTPLPSVKVKAPRVKESAVHFECKLVHTYDVINKSGSVSTTIVIGEVVMVHINQGVTASTPSGKVMVDFKKLRPVARLGGNIYGTISRMFELPRPDRNWQDLKPVDVGNGK